MKTTYRGIGVMSGTSMDALDLAWCTFTEEEKRYTFSLDLAEAIPIEPEWKARLIHLPSQSAEVFAKTHVYFGHWMGKTIRSFIDRHNLSPDFVAAHGQTIFHRPYKTYTVQIGDGETVVSYLPCPLVTNFRNKDVALGGEGAPLVPIGEKFLFPDHELFLNLGGISNLSYQGKAFDISPCNLLLNHIYTSRFPEHITDFDPEGNYARKGMLHTDLLEALDHLDFYSQPYPKSLGWEWVEEVVLPLIDQYNYPPEDILHTCTHHIAGQIAAAVHAVGAKSRKMLTTGGGRHNLFLVECLEKSLRPVDVTLDTGVSDEIVDFKEAIVFGFLGLRTLTGKTTTLSSVTGAKSDLVTGSIHLPPGGGFSLFRKS
ncbi:MAG: anhydro-N-acetylmuramic acid kinase [Bacteroidia bacterium]